MKTLVLSAAAALAMTFASPALAGPEGAKPGIVDAATARKLVAGGIKVVDVRTPAEFSDGHVPGAVNIPFDQVEKRLAEIGPPATPVLLYCRTGRRSGIAAKVLEEKGFQKIYDLQAYDRWVASEPAKK